jgi:hypothetical protein
MYICIDNRVFFFNVGSQQQDHILCGNPENHSMYLYLSENFNSLYSVGFWQLFYYYIYLYI